MYVRDRMTSPAVVIAPDATASSALAFMEKRRIRRLPVVQDGKLVGIVTMSDLEKAARKPSDEPVRTVGHLMTPRPLTVERDETLEVAAGLMMTRKVSGLPVMDAGRVVGILTESDLFRALCEMLGVGEKGARIVMSVDDDQSLLESIRGRLKGMAVRSLVTVHNPKRAAWDVVLRVRGREETALAGGKE